MAYSKSIKSGLKDTIVTHTYIINIEWLELMKRQKYRGKKYIREGSDIKEVFD